MKRFFTAILIVAITLIIFVAYTPKKVYAETSASSILSSADEFIKKGKDDEKIKPADVKAEVIPIANILVGIATVVFIVVGGILGVQYAFGGADQKAGIKQKLIWFVVAVVLVYGAVGIFNIAVTIFSQLSS